MSEDRKPIGRRPKYTQDQVLEEWGKIKDSPDENLTYGYASNHYDWFSSAGTHFGKRNDDWYGFLSEMGKTDEEIERIRSIAKKIKRDAAREANIKFSEEQVLAAWELVKDAPDEELTYAYATKKYAWFSSACTQIAGKAGDWYGFLSAMEKSDEEIERIKEVGRKSAADAAREWNLGYTEDEILEKWEKIKRLPDERLAYRYARENYDWFFSACSIFGQRNDNWYGFLRAMGKSEEEIERIKEGGRRRAADAVGKRSQKYTRKEVLSEWEKIKNAPDGELTYVHAKKNYAWFSSAGTHFGERNDDWYGFLRAMGKSEEEIARIRKAARAVRSTPADRTSEDGRTIVIIEERNGVNGQPQPTDYSSALASIDSPEFIATREYDPKVVRVVLSTAQRDAPRVQTPAEEVRRMIGLGADWNDLDFAQKYKEALPQMAPWVVHRASILYLLGMVQAGEIEMPEKILSAASGPSEVYESVQDLRQVFETNGIGIPEVWDLDLSEAMLLVGSNKNQKVGDIRETGFGDGEFGMLENSSIYQFKPPDVKRALIESNRVVKEGGHIFLVCNGKRFSDSFYDGLEECGFEMLSSRNQMLCLSSSSRQALAEIHGDRFARKFDSSLGNSVIILARKVREAGSDVDENKFTFEDFDPVPKEMREFLADYREFIASLDRGDVSKCHDSRERMIGSFEAIRKRKPSVLKEYNAVFTRAQAKFREVVLRHKDAPGNKLKEMQTVNKPPAGALVSTWRTLGLEYGKRIRC